RRLRPPRAGRTRCAVAGSPGHTLCAARGAGGRRGTAPVRRALAARDPRALVVPDLATAIAVSNEYAPEHLILQIREPRRWLPEVRSAGSVFLGQWSPEPLGDYCSGTNHVLPTYGYARAY